MLNIQEFESYLRKGGGEPIFENNITGFLKFLLDQRKKSAIKAGLDTQLSKMFTIGLSNKEKKIFNSDPNISPVIGDIKDKGGIKKENVSKIIDALNKYGIINPYVIKSILSVIGKESSFIPQDEKSYANTSNERIRKIFRSRVSKFNDPELSSLKKSPNDFWEAVYGGRYGNTAKGDGARYRGRGYNQLTFKGNYKKYGDILKKSGTQVDVLSNPNKVNDPKIAAEIAALYFLDQLNSAACRKKYLNKDVNDFSDFNSALKAVVNVNAGINKDINTGSLPYTKALAYSGRFNSNITNIA